MKLFFIISFLLYIVPDLNAAGEDWRSRASGNWTTPATWEYSTNNGSTWITATVSYPEISSDEVEVRSGHNVTIPASTSLSVDQFTIRTGGIITLNSSSVLTINDGAGTDFLMEGSSSIVSAGGYMKNAGSNVLMIIRNSTNFNVPLKIDSANVTIYNDGSPFIAVLKNVIEVDSGATLASASGGYTIQADSTVRNLGTISGSGGSRFIVNGYAFKNLGTINVSTLDFNDSTGVTADTTSKSGKFISPNINFNSTSKVTHAGSNWTIGPATVNVNLNSGSRLNVSTGNFILDGTSGTISFDVANTATVLGSGAGYPFQTKGTVVMNLQSGSVFSSPFKTMTGTTTVYCSNSPHNAITNSPLIIDTGAVLYLNNGGYTLTSNASVINNGTISGTSGALFSMKGGTFTNNGTVNVNNFAFDDTVSFVNTNVWIPTNTYIRNGGSAVISNNMNVGTTAGINLYVQGGGTLNLNGFNFTIDGSTGTDNFEVNANGLVRGNGLFQTKGTVFVILQTSSAFNSQFKVMTGTSTVYCNNSPNVAILNSTITIDGGATLYLNNGGYTLRSNGSVTNNGTISGTSGANFAMYGNFFNNFGNITSYNFSFNDTTTITSTGLWSSGTTYINAGSVLTLGTNFGIGTSAAIDFVIQSNGVMDLKSYNLNVDSNVTTDNFTIVNNGLLRGSGRFQSNGNVNLNVQTGGKFLVPLKILKGTTSAYCSNAPNVITLDSSITVDTSANLYLNNGGYTMISNASVTNNGTISGTSGATLKYYGNTLTNNGSISVSNFNFESIVFSPTSYHNVSGTGAFTTSSCNIVQGANVTLLSNHKFHYLDVQSGSILNLNSRTIKLTGGGNPMTVSGTVLASGSTIEYNGTSLQTIVPDNIDFNNITINNPAGTILSNSFSIGGTITLLNGDIDLNGKILTLLSNALLSETSGNTIKGNSGYITTTRTINSPSAVNVAGLGATISSAATLGLTEIRRGHAIITLPGGNSSIRRYYAFNPSNNNSLNATLTMKYDTSELNGQNERVLSLFKSTNGGASFFPETGILDTVNNTYTQTQLASLNRTTFGTGTGFVNITVTPEALYNSSTGRLNARDTIRLYLRNNISPYNRLDSSRGKLDSVTLSVNLAFANAVTDTFYFEVRHRNSLETWSKAGGQRFATGDTAYYNFTSAQNNAYGGNMTIKGTKWCLYSGDTNQDGIIEAADVSRIDNDAAEFLTGYVISDLDGNGFVDGSDFYIADNNAANFISKITP